MASEKEPKIKLVNATARDVAVAEQATALPVIVAPDPVPVSGPELKLEPKAELKSETESKQETADQKFSKKFLFVTDEALSVDLAWKIKEEGNDVKMYIGNEDDQDIGEGF